MKQSNSTRTASIPQNFQGFLESDYASGSLLLLATLAAILLANGPFSEPYHQLLGHALTLHVGPLDVTETVREWINATLMAVFFLTVGLEIKQELVLGSLSSMRRAALPVAAAIDGMLTPAGIFTLFNWGQPSIIGWAIPMATDPAFAIAVPSALRSRIPIGLRAFLIAVAVVDDIGATIVIALVYHQGFLLSPLLISLAIVLLLLINKARVQSLVPYLLLGFLLWAAFLESGIHTSVAAVILALTIPVRSKDPGRDAPLNRLAHQLAPWVNFLILPLFALSNAGISFWEVSLSAAFQSAITIGILLGLVVGKPIGIIAVSYLAVRLRAAHFPQGVRWRHVTGAGFLGGIGFTTSIFLAGLAFAGGTQFTQSKIGILTASLVAGWLGGLILWRDRNASARNP